MPMTTAEKFDKVQQLKTEYERIKIELEGMTDIHKKYSFSQNLILFSTGYRRLGLALKYLIAEEQQITIDELVQIKDSIGNPVYSTNNIKDLFSLVDECTKKETREYYERFQSSHSYIPIQKLDQLIEVASDQVEKCKEDQSYTVNESDEISLHNCAVALTAILGNCINIVEKRL